jgi:predicted phage tail protein
LIKDLGLSSSNVPLLAGQLVDATQGGLCAGHNNIINNLPSTIPTSHVISSAGCTDVADNLHFSSAGYRLLGARYATKMLSLLPPVVKNIVPLVSITEPLNQNYTAPASITVSATATDADGSITSVGFYNGNKLLFSDNNFPYSYNWVNVDAGIYNLTAIAIDNTGAKDTSSILKVIVAKANAKPVVELYTSVNDFNLSAPAYISLTANATDADGSISSVGFYNGNTLLSTDYTEPYSYDWSNVQKGIYNITARAIDNNGASDTSAVLDFNVSVVNALNDFETLINNTNVFPNPFNEMVNVPENIEYQIIDINGLIVEKGLTRINSQIGQNLITGSYTLTLQKGKIKKYIQIIKNYCHPTKTYKSSKEL